MGWRVRGEEDGDECLLVGGGGAVLREVVPRRVFIQNVRPVRRPRHDVQPVT